MNTIPSALSSKQEFSRQELSKQEFSRREFSKQALSKQALSATTPPKNHTQAGATLIVVMVILLVMTFLGLAGLSDSRLQLTMVRNSQFQTAAYTAALSEINAQIDTINTNGVGAVDQVIVDLLNARPVTTQLAGVSVDSRTLKTDDSNNFNRFLNTARDNNNKPLYSSYSGTLILREPDITTRLPISGMSLDPENTIKWRLMEFESTADIDNTDFQSQQVQGFRYLAPN